MAWSSRGLRGSTFEEMINLTNEVYEKKNLAIIQKIPTPITPVKLNADRQITLAYFEKKSTVDYIGAVQGIPICFDAKETTLSRLPLQNVHEHQMAFMENFEKQRGIAFFLVNFLKYNECYYLPFKTIDKYWTLSRKGGRKSIPYEAFDKNYMVGAKSGCYFHYLEAVNRDLQDRRGENN